MTTRSRKPKGSVRTSPHSMRCDDRIWERAQSRATRHGFSMNFVLTAMLDAYGRGKIAIGGLQTTVKVTDGE